MKLVHVVAAITVSPHLLDVCFLALMGLGVYVVIKVVANPPRGGDSEFSLLGSQVKVKGPAWLVMLVVGALMAAAPVVAAASQDSAATPFEPPQPAAKVQSVPEPNYASFVFTSDVGVLDLRTAVGQPWLTRIPFLSSGEGTHKRIRPATLTNVMRVRKVAPADYIYVKYATTGALDLRCVTHPYQTQLTANSAQGQSTLR